MPKQKGKYIRLTQKMKIMNLENELLEKFQVEELEKRFEFSWIDGVVVGTEGSPSGSDVVNDGQVTPFVNAG